MRKLMAAFGVVLLWAVGCGPGAMKEYTSAEGKFKVMMYDNAKKEEQASLGTQAHVLGNESGNRLLYVAYADLPIGGDEPEEQAQKRLEDSRDGMLKKLKAELGEDSKTTLEGKYPGRSFGAGLPGGKGELRARVYLAGKRLYQVVAMGPKGFVDSDDVKKEFFGKFQLLP